MKKILCIILILLFITPAAFAAHETPYVRDMAETFTPEELGNMERTLEEFTTKYDTPAYLVTVNKNADDIQDFTDLLLEDYVGINKTGVIFLIDWGSRKYCISTSGEAIDYITDSRLEQMTGDIEAALRNGDPLGAATCYTGRLNEFYQAGIPEKPDRTPTFLGIGAIVGLIGGQGFYSATKKKYKGSYREKNFDVTRYGQLHLTLNVDNYLYTDTTARSVSDSSDDSSSDSTTHTSSSGGTHGGTSGSF